MAAPFPFTDQTAAKKRPAVVVSSSAHHRERPDLILMAVTRQPASGARVGEVRRRPALTASGRRPVLDP